MLPNQTGDSFELKVAGLDTPVEVRRSARAARLILKVNEARRGAVLTMPPHASLAEASDFLTRHFDWLQTRLAAIPEPIPFADGARVPLRGIEHVLQFAGPVRRRGVVWTEAGDEIRDRPTDWSGEAMPASSPRPRICVAGETDHAPRRLKDWLAREAKKDLTARVAWHGDALGLKAKRISVRDQSTRWGSCSSTGVLSFSWRLILAPHFVLDYVAAHEVAHLKEMNHSPAFWRLVRQSMARTDEAKRWLKTHGAALHRYGASG
ncbi:MAG: M48 family metallopeptidase [Methyloligellaceae bacterium]